MFRLKRVKQNKIKALEKENKIKALEKDALIERSQSVIEEPKIEVVCSRCLSPLDADKEEFEEIDSLCRECEDAIARAEAESLCPICAADITTFDDMQEEDAEADENEESKRLENLMSHIDDVLFGLKNQKPGTVSRSTEKCIETCNKFKGSIETFAIAPLQLSTCDLCKKCEKQEVGIAKSVSFPTEPKTDNEKLESMETTEEIIKITKFINKDGSTGEMKQIISIKTEKKPFGAFNMDAVKESIYCRPDCEFNLRNQSDKSSRPSSLTTVEKGTGTAGNKGTCCVDKISYEKLNAGKKSNCCDAAWKDNSASTSDLNKMITTNESPSPSCPLCRLENLNLVSKKGSELDSGKSSSCTIKIINKPGPTPVIVCPQQTKPSKYGCITCNYDSKSLLGSSTKFPTCTSCRDGAASCGESSFCAKCTGEDRPPPPKCLKCGKYKKQPPVNHSCPMCKRKESKQHDNDMTQQSCEEAKSDQKHAKSCTTCANKSEESESCPLCAKKSETKSEMCPLCGGRAQSNKNSCPLCAMKAEESKRRNSCPTCVGKSQPKHESYPECVKNTQPKSDSCPVCCKNSQPTNYYSFHWCAKNNETKNENSCPICAKKAEEFKKTNECPMCSKKSESKAEGCPMCAKKLDKSETEKICPICKKLDEKKGCPVCEKKSEQPSMSCPLCNKKIENCPICSMKKPEESSEKDDKKDKIDDKELQHTCKSCDGKDMKNACPICGAVEAEKAAKEKARSECPFCGKAKPEGPDDIKNKDKNSEDKKEPELKHSCKFCDISKDKKESCAVCTAVEDEEATTQSKSLCDFCGADKSTEKEGTCPSCAKLKECKICKERLAKKNICPLCLAKAKSAPDTSVSGDFFHRVDSLCPSCKKGDNKSKSECKMCLENAEKHKAKDICQICGPDPDKLEVKPKEITESPCSSCKAGDKKSETPCKMCEENVAIDEANKEPKCTCAEKREESTYKKGIESKCSCQKNKDQDEEQDLCPKCGRNKSPKPAFKFSSLCDYCKEEYIHKKPSCLCGKSKPAASSCLCKHCQEVAAPQEPPGCPICAQKSQKSLCFFCADNKSSKSSFQVCGRPLSEKGRGKVCSFDPSLGALSGTDSNSEESCCDSNKSFGIETEACVQSCDYSYKSMSNEHEVDDEPICCSTQTAKKPSLKSCCSNNKRPVGHTCCFSEPKSCPECRIRVPMADASTITKTADRYDVRPIRLIAGARGTSDTTVKPLCCCKPEPTRLCNCKSEPICSPFFDKRNMFKSKSFN